MKKLMIMGAVSFGLLLCAQAAYLMGVDQSSVGGTDVWSINLFDTDVSSSRAAASYEVSGLGEIDNIVFESDSIAYGFASDGGSGSSLYKFVLSGDEVSYTEIATSSMFGTIDSITLAGDRLYIVNDGDGGLDLQSVDLTGNDASKGMDLGAFNNMADIREGKEWNYDALTGVQGLTYDESTDTLYAIGETVSDTTYLYSFEINEYGLSGERVGEVTLDNGGVNGLEGLAYADGSLYAGSSDTLYTIDMSSGAVASATGWGYDLQGLSGYAPAETGVPEPGSVLAWVLGAGGVGYMVRRKRAAA